MLITHSFKKFGLVRQELEHLVDEGMDPYWYNFDDDPDYDPDDGLSYEERRFNKMWECDSSESDDEGGDDSPWDGDEGLDPEEEDWRRHNLIDEVDRICFSGFQ